MTVTDEDSITCFRRSLGTLTYAGHVIHIFQVQNNRDPHLATVAQGLTAPAWTTLSA